MLLQSQCVFFFFRMKASSLNQDRVKQWAIVVRKIACKTILSFRLHTQTSWLWLIKRFSQITSACLACPIKVPVSRWIEPEQIDVLFPILTQKQLFYPSSLRQIKWQTSLFQAVFMWVSTDIPFFKDLSHCTGQCVK